MRRIHPRPVYERVMGFKPTVKGRTTTIVLVSKKTRVPYSTISAWYRGRQPFFKLSSQTLGRESVEKLIPKTSMKLSPEKAYILGVICGDGYVNYKEGHLMLEVIDEHFLTRFKKDFVKVYGPHFQGKTSKTCNSKSRFVVCGKAATDDIRRYLPQQSSPNWTVPPQIMKSNHACKCMFIKGFFDSEGTVCKKYSLNFSSMNKRGLYQIKCLLASLNIMTSEIKPSKNIYRLYVTGKQNIIRFAKGIGSSIPDKYKKMETLLQKYHARG